MLVLGRKKGEAINIGDNIRIVVLDVAGDSARIGIEAPKELAVYRSEIYEAIQEENKAAMASRETAAKVKAMAFLETAPQTRGHAKHPGERKE